VPTAGGTIERRAIKRDSDLWQVEKVQFTTLMTRSSTFLDSFWKLSRKNEIPDRWLLRDQDLDQLSDTLEEKDSERRLRMLARQNVLWNVIHRIGTTWPDAAAAGQN
jgi:hypothetical protein